MSAGNGSTGPEKPVPPEWLTDDASVGAVPPLTNNASSRSPEALEAVVDQFDVENSPRYRPRDVTGDGKKETWCNLYVSDLTMALCAPIPRQWRGKWQLVADQLKWLRAGYNGWRPCTDDEAQTAANHGMPAVVVWVPPEGHGHIALLVPRPSGSPTGIWLTQAGARCYRRAPLMAGFGSHTTELHWYQHD